MVGFGEGLGLIGRTGSCSSYGGSVGSGFDGGGPIGRAGLLGAGVGVGVGAGAGFEVSVGAGVELSDGAGTG